LENLPRLPVGTAHAILHNDLGLVKKSAHWVPKLLTTAQKKEWTAACDFLGLLQQHSLPVLDNIVIMGESAVSFHTPEMKRQSKQWVKNCQPGPWKARIHAKGKTVNTEYIKKALARFLKVFREKRPIMSS
jgi:hypothetical protein